MIIDNKELFQIKDLSLKGDASNSQIVLNLLKKYKPSLVYHTAALPLAKIENLNATEASIGSIEATKESDRKFEFC